MFIGHFGVALAAKRLTPRTSLATLFVGAQFLDLLWPIFLLLGMEHVRIAPGITKVQGFDFYDYPFSHSLTMVLRWALAVALLYWIVRRSARGAVVLGSLVASHWFLDFVVHRPDLPLWPGGPKYGLGLWNSWAASLSLEVLLFAAGVWLYVGATKARDKVGRYGFWALIVFLFVAWLGAIFAPPPPDVRTLAWGSMSLWVVVAWGWWVDGHRSDEIG